MIIIEEIHCFNTISGISNMHLFFSLLYIEKTRKNNDSKMSMKEVKSTVRLRIKTENLTSFKKQRLKQITGRDTRTIKKLIRIIYHNEERITSLTGKVNKKELDKLTLTTSKGQAPRTKVRHDLKTKFPRSSHDELQECRDTAVTMFHSLKKLDTTWKGSKNKKLPRTQSANRNRFKLECAHQNTIARWWVGIRDSMESPKTTAPRHKRLWLPLACSPYHEQRLKSERIQALELIYSYKKKEWWVHFILSHTPNLYASSRPPAVLGIDLGINKRAVSALLTPKGVLKRHEIRFWSDKTRKIMLNKHENSVAKLQKKLANLERTDEERQKTIQELKFCRRKQRRENKLTDNTYVNRLVNYILSLSRKYEIFVVVGYPMYIHRNHPRGNQFPKTRKKVHQWNYRRVIELLKFKLSLQGFEDHRVLAIGESWTSSMCSRCGSYNTLRSKQPTFICKSCGYELNADLNGAKNIAKRLIKYVLQPKYLRIKDLLTEQYFPLHLFRVFTVLSQWL